MSSFVGTVQSRGYELDARKRVTPGAFARWFEHARWEAIHAHALGLRELFRDERRLVIRAQRLALDAALGPHEVLSLALSITHVGRSSIRMAQSARLGDTLIARCEAVAVVLDADGRPTRVPEAVRAHVGDPAPAPLDALGPPSATPAYECDVYVRPSDLDTLQHVNQSRYVDFADDVLQHALAAGAFGPSAPMRPVAITVEYQRETRLDPARGPDTRLRAQVFPEGAGGYGVALRDPLSEALVARSTIVVAHENDEAAGAALDAGL